MNKRSENLTQEIPDYRELLKPYIKNWKWFVVSGFIALLIGFMYNRYAVPKYAVQAKIQIIDDANGSSQFNVFEDLGIRCRRHPNRG